MLNQVLLNGALGCAVDAAGNIYVASSSGITKYDSAFNLVDSAAVGFSFGVAIDNDGKIYYTDYQTSVHSPKQRPNRPILPSGRMEAFRCFSYYAGGLFYCNDKLYACSEMDNQVKQMNADGTNIEVVIEGTGPTNVFITDDYLCLPAFGAAPIFKASSAPRSISKRKISPQALIRRY